MKYLLSFFIALVFVISSPANSDEGLYGAIPPPGSAFFRFVNQSDQQITVSHEGKKLSTINDHAASPYGFVNAGKIDFDVNGKSFPVTMEKGKSYTLLVDGGSLKEVVESPYDNKRKSRVKLYNLTEFKDVSLKTADGAHAVVESVDPHSVGERDVNAVDIQFSVESKHFDSFKTDTVNLKKGKVSSIFVYQKDGKLQYASYETDR